MADKIIVKKLCHKANEAFVIQNFRTSKKIKGKEILHHGQCGSMKGKGEVPSHSELERIYLNSEQSADIIQQYMYQQYLNRLFAFNTCTVLR